MAFRWRIRHKLMLGLGVVVAIIGVLLAGTLYGLTSYRATMKSIGSKLVELKSAQKLREIIKTANAAAHQGTAESNGELQRLLHMVEQAHAALDEYEERLNDTVAHGRDPDHGFVERGLIEALRTYLDDLQKAAKKVRTEARVNTGPSLPLVHEPPVKEVMERLTATSSDLLDVIYREHFKLSEDAKDRYKASLWIVILVSVGGVLLLCSMLRFFYKWVFSPIQDLEKGAGRIAHGDFEHRIEVHSGDEMEDLAAAFNDMTGRLREMYGDLARQVNERSRQLVRSERLVSVGYLAAGVAHEINNPLASIAFCSEALEQRLVEVFDGSPEKDAEQKQADREVIERYLRMIQQEAFRCKEITQRLLEFSRGGERSREPAKLADLVQSVLDMVAHLENYKGKNIVFQPNPKITAWINTQEIKSVVLNLVVNALDSMDDGGTLTIRMEQREGMAVLEFSDTGCGMTAEVLENIFEPFYTRSRTGRGTGLGLSISHRIISQHGGEIEATSEGPGQGSTFTVRLPMTASKEETLGQHAA
ncbi:MAG: ATPase [Gemmatales bacterium]|nr:MAG: ATPase [Gemmatales bacterium]